MKKLLIVCCASAIGTVVCGQPASKATASSSIVTVVFPGLSNATPFTTATATATNFSGTGFMNSSTSSTSTISTPWTPILTASFKPPGGKDLFITFSGITGLMTFASDETTNDAFVSNSGFSSSTNTTAEPGASAFANANLRIEARVLVDSTTTVDLPPSSPLLAAPGVVTLDNMLRNIAFTSDLTLSRSQFSTAFSSDTTTVSQTDLLTLALEEGGARAFTFIKQDVGVGNHTITVQARYSANNLTGANANAFSGAFASAGSASSGATAGAIGASQVGGIIGPRTLAVEEVKLNQ